MKSEHRRLIRRLQQGKKIAKDTVLITYAYNGADLFDLIPAKELKFPYRKRQELFVLGLAGDKEEAAGLVGEMVTEVYEATGGFDVRGYFGYEAADWR
ncbi:MAG: hypothetical protein IJY09_05020 [Lachnospiraceae bacterium]|nr:hypothetical protein [Lachnospiraceae bacterium]